MNGAQAYLGTKRYGHLAVATELASVNTGTKAVMTALVRCVRCDYAGALLCDCALRQCCHLSSLSSSCPVLLSDSCPGFGVPKSQVRKTSTARKFTDLRNKHACAGELIGAGSFMVLVRVR